MKQCIFVKNTQNYCVMKVKLLISLVLAFTAYVGAMTSENDSCQTNGDSVQVRADSTQLSDPPQGYIFDRDIDGWKVQSCPGYIFYSFVDSCGDFESIMKSRRAKKYSNLKSPWEKDPRSFGVNGYFKLNGNKKQSPEPDIIGCPDLQDKH